MDIEWVCVVPIVGLVCAYIIVQLLLCFIWSRKTDKVPLSMTSHHLLSNIDKHYLVIVIATGSGKGCDLRNGNLRLNIHTKNDELLNIDVSKARVHDEYVFTSGHKDTFYVGYSPKDKPKLDQIALILTPKNKYCKSNWYGEYVYICDSYGKRVFYLLQHAFQTKEGLSEIVYIHEHPKSVPRLVLDSLFNGMQSLHLWLNAFGREACMWQRVLPISLTLAIIVPVTSLLSTTTREEDTVFALMVSSVMLFPLIATLVGVSSFYWVLEFMFRHVKPKKFPDCYCPNDCVKVIKCHSHDNEKQTLTNEFRKSVTFTLDIPTTDVCNVCGLCENHYPGSVKCDHSEAAGFLDHEMEKVEQQVQAIADTDDVADSVSQPVKPTEMSDATIELSDVTTELPDGTTDKPETSTSRSIKPDGTTDKPETSTSRSIKPDGTTDKPETSNSRGFKPDDTLDMAEITMSRSNEDTTTDMPENSIGISNKALNLLYQAVTFPFSIKNVKAKSVHMPSKRPQHFDGRFSAKKETEATGAAAQEETYQQKTDGVDANVTSFVNSVITGATERIGQQRNLAESNIDRAMKLLATKEDLQQEGSISGKLSGFLNTETETMINKKKKETNERQEKRKSKGKASAGKAYISKPNEQPTTTELLIKELVQRTLADPEESHLPHGKGGSTSLLTLIRNELEHEDLSGYAGKPTDSLQDLLEKHLSVILHDLAREIFAALKEKGMISEKKIESSKRKSQRLLTDFLQQLVSQSHLHCDLHRCMFSDIKPQAVSSDSAICSHHEEPLHHHRHSDTQLTDSDSRGSSNREDSPMGEDAHYIKSSLTAFGNLRTQRVLETVCHLVTKKLSSERIAKSQQTASTFYPSLSHAEVIPISNDGAIPLTKKGSSSLLLHDVNDALSEISLDDLATVTQASLQDIWSPKKKHIINDIISELLNEHMESFSKNIINKMVDIIVHQNKTCCHPDIRENMIPDTYSEDSTIDINLQTSLLEYAITLMGDELENLDRVEDTMYKLAMIIQYIDTVVTNSLLQAHTTIQQGISYFTNVRINKTNNSNIDPDASLLRLTLLNNIVSKMTAKSGISDRNFVKFIMEELSKKEAGNYLVCQSMSRGMDYIVQVFSAFDLESLAVYSLRMNKLASRRLMQAGQLCDVISQDLEKCAVQYGCQVVAEQMFDFYSRDDVMFALEMAEKIKTSQPMDLLTKLQQTSGKACVNLFTECLSSDELYTVITDLEDIRTNECYINMNQNQGQAQEAPFSEQYLENGVEGERLLPEKGPSREYWTTAAYPVLYSRLLPKVFGRLLLILCCLIPLGGLAYLLWIVSFNSALFSCTWASIIAIMMAVQVIVFETCKSFVVSLVKVFILSDWSSVLRP